MLQLADNERMDRARAAMRRFRRLSTLPEVALRIVERAGSKDCDATELALLFREDPALCTVLLKVANSPFYGLRHQVACVDHASNLLGVRALRGVAIAASVGKLFSGADQIPGFSIRILWRHLLETAAAAKLIATELDRADPDEAFTSGLIHDLGLVLMMQLNSERFAKLVSEVERDSKWCWDQRELEIFAATHDDYGVAFCESLGLPDSIISVVAEHHDLTLAGESDLATIVKAAHALGDSPEHGLLSAPPRDPVTEKALAKLSIDEGRLESLRVKLAEQMAQSTGLF